MTVTSLVLPRTLAICASMYSPHLILPIAKIKAPAKSTRSLVWFPFDYVWSIAVGLADKGMLFTDWFTRYNFLVFLFLFCLKLCLSTCKYMCLWCTFRDFLLFHTTDPFLTTFLYKILGSEAESKSPPHSTDLFLHTYKVSLFCFFWLGSLAAIFI